MTCHVCPVLAITDDVRHALAWFDRCYAFEPDALGVRRWTRVGFPRAGGLADQDAKLMDALETLLAIHQQLSRTAAPRRPSDPATPRSPRRSPRG